MSRRAQLEERRRALLVRCDEQRAELAYRLERIRPSTQVARWSQQVPAMAMNYPLGWIAAALVGIVVLFRRKSLLSWLTFATGAMSIVSRATPLLRLLTTLRLFRSGFR